MNRYDNENIARKRNVGRERVGSAALLHQSASGKPPVPICIQALFVIVLRVGHGEALALPFLQAKIWKPAVALRSGTRRGSDAVNSDWLRTYGHPPAGGDTIISLAPEYQLEQLMVVPVIYAELMQGPGAERTGGSGAGGGAPSRRHKAVHSPRALPGVVAARPLGATALPETLRAITLAALESKREALVGLIPADWRMMLDGLPAGAPRAPEGGGAAGAGKAPKMSGKRRC
jgi:hypothetical protein